MRDFFLIIKFYWVYLLPEGALPLELLPPE